MVARRRYITRALVERYGPTEDCGACFRKSQQHTERCRARWRGRPSRGQSPGGTASSTRSSSTESHLNVNGSTDGWSRHGRDGVRGHWAGSEQPNTCHSRTDQTICHGSDETMEQEGPESKRQRTVAGLPVCFLLASVDEIPVSYHTRDR